MSTRVLVVEDEFLIRWAVSQQLSDAGFDVVEAEDLASARERIAENGVSLVVLDLKLPDGDGRELLASLHEARPELPVVVMSAHASPELGDALVRAGATRFFPKPFDVERLVAEAGRICGNSVSTGAGAPPSK